MLTSEAIENYHSAAYDTRCTCACSAVAIDGAEAVLAAAADGTDDTEITAAPRVFATLRWTGGYYSNMTTRVMSVRAIWVTTGDDTCLGLGCSWFQCW